MQVTKRNKNAFSQVNTSKASEKVNFILHKHENRISLVCKIRIADFLQVSLFLTI
jgi:hypothetical protein